MKSMLLRSAVTALLVAQSTLVIAQTPLSLDQLIGGSISLSRSLSDGGTAVCGSFTTSVNVSPALVQGLSTGSASAAFAGRFNAAGQPVWLSLLARSSGPATSCSGLSVDSRDRIYAIGSFTGEVEFSGDSGAVFIPSLGGRDVFIVAKESGGRTRWVQTFGGPENEASGGIAVKPNGAGLVASGSFRSTVDFDPSAGFAPLQSLGGNDGFLLNLSLAGEYQSALPFSGVGQSTYLSDVLVDPVGALYAVGFADNQTDLDPGPGQALLTTQGGIEQVLIKLTANQQFEWFRASSGLALGTLATAERLISNRQLIFVTGAFSGDIDFDPSPNSRVLSNLPQGSAFGAYALAFDTNGGFQWAEHLLASQGQRTSVEALSAAADGGALVGGRFSGASTFAPNQGAPLGLLADGLSDGYFARLNSRGKALSFAVISGNATDAVRQITAHGGGQFSVSADFQNLVDFDFSSGSMTLTGNAGDGALARYYDDLIYADGYQP